MLCTAVLSVDVVQCADPAPSVSPMLVLLSPLPVSVQVIGLMPSKNCTLPAGGPVTAVVEATVAVKMTGLPGVDGLAGFGLTVVVVSDFDTLCGLPFWPPLAVNAVPFTAAKFVSPG